MPNNPRDSSSHRTQKHPATPVKSANAGGSSGQPIFGQPKPSPDPTGFKNPVTDQKFQGIRNLEALPQPRGGAAEPVLTLPQVYGSEGAAKIAAIQQAGQIVFHSTGDTGSVVGPATQSLVADKMVTDFNEVNLADVPSFLFHLGDVVYYFGEATYYYDQFLRHIAIILRRSLRSRAIMTAWCIRRTLLRRWLGFWKTSVRRRLRHRRTRVICFVPR